jgi:DNA-binding IclR family transcriptional regulator
LTPATIVERSCLEEAFTASRKRGYALSQGEVFSEVAGMAAPVFNHEGSV